MGIIKKIWPYLFIFLVWFIFSSPYFIKGNVPFASTYQVNFFSPWSTYPEFSGPVKNNAMPDIINQIYPWKYLTIQTYSLGQIPLWNPYSFSGTPHLANYQSAVLSPFNLVFFILPFIDAWSILVLFQSLLAGVFTFLFTRSLNRSKVAGLISSVSFMFCGFLTTWMGYATLSFAILFLPLALYGIEKFFNLQRKRFLVLTSLTFPLSFFSGHFQISLYFLITVIVYIFIKFLLTRNIKLFLFCLFSVFLGLLISAPQLLPSIELYTQSLRSGLFLKLEAIPISYLPTFLAPDFFGNPVTRNDWFGHYAEWNGYLGLIPFILAIYAILSKKNKQIIYLFVFSIIVLLIAFNTPILNLIVLLKIPVLSTSAASRIIVVHSFVFSVLASFGFDYLINDLKKGVYKKITFLLFIMFFIFFLMWGYVFLNIMPIDKSIIARQNLILPSIIFIFFIFFIFSSFKLRKRKMVLGIVAAVILLAVSFDMLRFSTKWMPFDPKNLVFKETETLTKLKELSGYDRFLGNLGGEVINYYGILSAEGYDAVYQKRYGEFISFVGSGKIDSLERSVVRFPKRAEFTSKAINLLGIKYIVHKKADARAIWTFPFWEYEKETFKLIYEDNKYEIYENNKVLPRAFLVNQYEVIKDNKQILDRLFSDDFDFSKSVILEEDIGMSSSTQSAGTASIQEYKANKIKFSVNANTDSLLFISDSYNPGWIAKVDGQDEKIYRGNYTFRAVPIAKGAHEVELIYFPNSFKYGLIISLFSVLGLILFSLPKKKILKS